MAQITLNSTGVASSGSLVLQTNGTTSAVTVDASQNVGIGVTPSASESSFGLQVGTAANTSYVYSKRGVANNAYYDGAWKYYGTGAATLHQFNSGVYSWYNAASGTAGNAITFTQVMTLDASGYLLVGGTSSAGAGNNRFQVGSTSSATSQALIQSTTTSMSFYASSAAEFYAAYATGSSFLIGNGPADGSAFTERARIDSSGNLLVGTTGVPNGTSIYGSGFAPISFGRVRLSMASSSTSSVQLVNFFNPNGEVGSISTSGSATAYTTSSDYRLKQNIQPMTGALAKVALLKPSTYKWKADNANGEGFIAHELAEVCPQAVFGNKDGVDEDGKPVYQAIDTSFLVSTLTAAIQEQQALITTLTQRITALEAK